ncbi:hypothetical protein ABEM27_07085 [Escherichia coli]
MLYNTGTIAINGNSATGTGTNWTAPASQVRAGQTIIVMSNPVQLFQISSVNSATSMTVTPAASPALSGQKYGILVSDIISVDGLAQAMSQLIKEYDENIGAWETFATTSANQNITVTINGTSLSIPALGKLLQKGSNGALPVNQGGTGATNAADALTNLGLPELLNLKRDKTDNRFSTFVFESGRPEDILWLAYDEQEKQFAIAFKVDGAAKYVYLQNKGGSLALEEQVTAQAILTKLLQVDGSGSGIDADLVRGLPADFGSSPSTNGYQKLPSGMIIQWGMSGATPTDVYVKFPVAFTRPPLFIGESSPGGGQMTSVWTANAITNVGFNATQICVLSNTSDRVLLPGDYATTWLAIGF